MIETRINKYLAGLGIASRRKIDEMITARRIKVNGKIIENGVKVTDKDIIEIDNKKINKKQEKKVYYILNKPLDVISAASDDRGRKTVVDYIRCKERIFPIGRLDYNTTGLIILTNDGELFNKIIHPKAEVFKKYEAVIKGKIDEKDIKKLENGVKLEDGMTLPAKVELIDINERRSIVDISIREGRNRQVRRMFAELGYRVINLQRKEIGNMTLGNLRVGQYRELTKKEVEYLYSL